MLKWELLVFHLFSGEKKMRISFLGAIVHDPNSDSIIIPVVIDNKLTKCNVSKECLDNKFYAGPQPEDLLATYRGHRLEIQMALAHKLRATGRRNGVTLLAADFND
ncbi:DUF1488 domain-containing protein [Collimonas sp.]|uniref:DUF1488 domain-containing protein n=1 Tax=Collimonas sp. TaxID=1963772 RepID=UPI002B65EDDC|nr:DUF1488 domain-containing protein [Collimonas sp.]HWW07862.1 DUF1488 domain-containing protein [Collimonas sp.]